MTNVPAPSPLLTGIANAPQAQQQQQLDQLKVDDAQFQSASQRLAVLTKIFQNNPGAAADPKMMDATQRAYKAMGMEAPTTTDGGKTSLDLDALGATAPVHSFVAQNFDMLSRLKPDDRDAAVFAATGQHAGEAITKLPQKFLQSPAEAGTLLNYVKTTIASLGKPGGSIDNVTAALQAVSKPLEEAFGMNSDMLLAGLKPDLYAQAMQNAQLMLMSAKTDKERATATSLMTMLPVKIQSIKTTDDLHKVMAEYYPQMAAAATTRASTDAALLPAKIEHLMAETGKDQAESTKINTENQGLIAAAQAGLKFGVKNPGELLNTLQKSAHESQQRVDTLQAKLQQAQLDAQTYAGQPYGQQAASAVTMYSEQIKAAQTQAVTANSLYQQTQHQLMGKPGDDQKPAVPQDMRPGTVEYYAKLTPPQKKEWIKGLPADVQQYLGTLH